MSVSLWRVAILFEQVVGVPCEALRTTIAVLRMFLMHFIGTLPIIAVVAIEHSWEPLAQNLFLHAHHFTQLFIRKLILVSRLNSLLCFIFLILLEDVLCGACWILAAKIAIRRVLLFVHLIVLVRHWLIT